jgi:hypothetical protein
VGRKRCLSKLVAELNKAGYLHSERYFWVIEFHVNGWPHWHILLDTTFIPYEAFCRVWNRLGTGDENTMFGMVRFSKGKGGRMGAFRSVKHAAYYVTKYIIKEPQQGWPEWVLNYRGNVMRYRAHNGAYRTDVEENDRAAAALLPDADAAATVDAIKERGKYRKTESARVRIAQCGNAALVFAQENYRWRYLGRVPHGAENMELWFGNPAWEQELPWPGDCEATDRLIWSYVGLSKAPRGCVNLAGDGLIEIHDAPFVEGEYVGLWRPDSSDDDDDDWTEFYDPFAEVWRGRE